MKSNLRAAILAISLLTSPAFAAPPANDNFADAVALSGDTGNASGTNVEATEELDEPSHLGSSSVWWSWTPTNSGTVNFDTLGSDFDTLLAVYTGTGELADLALLAENDDDDGNISSKVTFSATAGTTYWVAVTGWDVGNIELNWAPVAIPVGQISIYKQSSPSSYLAQGVKESSPAVPYTSNSTNKWTYYQIYDHTNGRATFVEYYTSKEPDPDTGRLVTKKYYMSGGLNYSYENFSYNVIPGRLAGTFQWISAYGFGSTYNDVEGTGEASTWGQGGVSQGTAVKVVLSPSLSIYVPRVLAGESLQNGHQLITASYDELGDPVLLEHPSREFYRSTDKWTATLDLNLTKAANLNDLIFEGQSHSKGTLENGLQLVIKLLKAQGYEEDTGYDSYY